ncbi:MAG: hypothetical protein IPK82_18230 [Polyangiaceae bacterium]|nr:hypothetical protein [Polyangiaceae bacterium]
METRVDEATLHRCEKCGGAFARCRAESVLMRKGMKRLPSQKISPTHNGLSWIKGGTFAARVAPCLCAAFSLVALLEWSLTSAGTTAPGLTMGSFRR